MEVKKFSKKLLIEDQLTILQTNVLRVANKLREKYRIIDIITLFEKCCKELPNPEPEIDQAIRELYRKKYFVKGKKLFKEDILANEKRRKLNEYIIENPGIHEREIRKIFKLGAFLAYYHLVTLKKYGFIRKKVYRNKSVYFPSDFEEAKEEKVFLLRNAINNRIFEYIKKCGEIRISELKNIDQIPYSTTRAHLKQLLEGGLIKKIMKDEISYYMVADFKHQEEIIEVKREYDYIEGNIRFSVAIANLTNLEIYDIIANLNSSPQFIINVPLQNVANLPPRTTRNIDFILTPITCGQSKVSGSISFKDAFRNVHFIPIPPKEIIIECPLIKQLTATQTEVNEFIKNLKRGTGKILFQNISNNEIFRIVQEKISGLNLSEIEIDLDKLWGLYTGQFKIIEKIIVIKIIIVNNLIALDVWADDLKQITGFIAYFTNLINIELKNLNKLVQEAGKVH